MSEVELWAAIVGFFLPVVIAAIQKAQWDDARKAWVAFGSCLVTGFGTAYFGGQLDLQNLDKVALDILIVFGAAITFYKGFWQKTGIAGAVERNILP